MVTSRKDRRETRRARVAQIVDVEDVDAALDALELMELAWHDCYGDVSPPDRVIDDALVLSQGDVRALVSAALLGVTDWRDLRLAADALRG